MLAKGDIDFDTEVAARRLQDKHVKLDLEIKDLESRINPDIELIKLKKQEKLCLKDKLSHLGFDTVNKKRRHCNQLKSN